MKKAVLIIAYRNFRDREYFIPREILEKAGVEVKVASAKRGIAEGADGGEAPVDLLLEEIRPADFDAVVFVGGPGALDYLDNEISYKLIKETVEQDKILAAICISPVILSKAGILKNKKATVWHSPIAKEPVKILKENGAEFIDEKVVSDGKIITANGPAAAEEFGQRILQLMEVN